MGKVTLKDLAKELGVSTTLVSRVLNAPLKADGTPDCDISRETAVRVLEAAARLDYRPSRFAAGLRSGKRYLIGVITPDISNFAFAEAGRYIEELAHQDGYSVMFGSSAENAGRLQSIMDIFADQNVDGIIVTPCAASEEVFRTALSRNIPVVLINRDIPSLKGVGRVFVNNISGMHRIVQHLISGGYRRIEMISEHMDVSSLHDREVSYCDTMRQAGLEPHIYHTDSDMLEGQTRNFVAEAYRKGTEALITPRIKLSLYALSAMEDLALAVPRDMALFCHDESPAWTVRRPTISYASQCADQVGTEAYRLLRSMMAGGTPEKVLIEPKLFFGDSSAPKKAALAQFLKISPLSF